MSAPLYLVHPLSCKRKKSPSLLVLVLVTTKPECQQPCTLYTRSCRNGALTWTDAGQLQALCLPLSKEACTTDTA